MYALSCKALPLISNLLERLSKAIFFTKIDRQLLQEYRIHANRFKWINDNNHVGVLGYMVSEQGISMDPAKIKKMMY